MAKKKVLAVVKIQIPAGQATPAPPVGTARTRNRADPQAPGEQARRGPGRQ